MKKVLIVDDEPSQRKVIAAALKQKGYQTLEASDGLEGLESARTHTPDLIITDVFMENMNGFIMVETLREDPETANIPVVMMTSAAQGAGAWQSMEDVEYIEKGFPMAKLVQLIEKQLNTKRS
jgi:CheY-like chemotaxis protein